MSDSTATGAVYESPNEPQDMRSFVKMWLDTLELANAEEKDWRKEAEDTAKVYAGKKSSKGKQFNIFHSNVETICPALYNSTPEPDVRRRFSDPDPVAKVVGDIIERAVAFSVDSYDFDAVMKNVVRDGEIPGRGVPRIRYEPLFGDPLLDGNGMPITTEDGQPLRELVSQGVTSEYVPWRFFRRGPGRTWDDVSWVAFGDFLTLDALRQINPECADKVPLNYTAGSETKNTQNKEKTIFKRALAWQIWDKDSRRVITVVPDYPDEPIKMVDDPLGLSDFFPTPRPYQPIQLTDTLTPVVPYSIYQDQVDELNEVTRRISRLIRQLRPRALYAGQEIKDIQDLAEADDGQLIPATGLDAFVGDGGVNKLISWFPMEPTALAIKQLLEHRERLKQTIYEVTGIADILRGSSNPSETLGAQQIKAQWGSLRIQNRQAEVARVARDLFRMKAEIIASKFQWETLEQMTGIKLLTAQQKKDAQMMMQAAQQPPMPGQPPQPAPQIPDEVKKALSQPTQEEAEQLMRSDIIRNYRIDVESDSTIRGDLTKNQQTMGLFLQGTAQFLTAMAPIIKEVPGALQPAIEVYSAFARQFKLGRQAEDALDALADSVRNMAANPQPPKPDPKVETEKIRQQTATVKAQAEVQKANISVQGAQAEHAANMQEIQGEAMLNQQEFAQRQQEMVHDQRMAAINQMQPQIIIPQ